MKALSLRTVALTTLLFLEALVLISSGTTYTLVSQHNHDESCFTQGLVYHWGYLWESCGLYGRSSIRKVHPSTGAVIFSTKLPADCFAEGISIVDVPSNSQNVQTEITTQGPPHGDAVTALTAPRQSESAYLFALTWTNRKLFVYMIHRNSDEIKPVGQIPYQTHNGEGWGLTYDGTYLIASDGTSFLSFFKVPTPPFNKAMEKVREVKVFDSLQGREVDQINELEHVHGKIYANIWYKDHIIEIDPKTGQITDNIDFRGLYPKASRTAKADCLNGIAYNESHHFFLLTGKQWPQYYQIKLKKTA